MTYSTQTFSTPVTGPQGKLLISTDFLLEGERVVLRLGRTTDWQNWRDLRSQSRAFLTPWEPTWPADALTYNAFTQTLEKQWNEWKDDRGYTFLAFLKNDSQSDNLRSEQTDDSAADFSPLLQNAASLTDEKKAFFSQFGRRSHDFSVMREMSERRPAAPAPGTSGTSAALLTAEGLLAEGKLPTSFQPSATPTSGSLKADKKCGTLIGSVALTSIVRGPALKGTMGYWIGAPYARQGLMTEAARLAIDFAFNVLKLHRLEASCMPANEPSLRLLQALGFEQEGLAKAALRINSKWEDHAVLALLSE